MVTMGNRGAPWSGPLAGELSLPGWLPRTALAEYCSVALLAIAAASAEAKLLPGECRRLLEAMEAADFFLPEGSRAAGERRLRPQVRQRMLAELDQRLPGIAGARGELLAAGLLQPAGDLGPQLAAWALEAGDWAILEAVWLKYSPPDLILDARARAAYAAVPSGARGLLPALSFAAALASAYEPGAGKVDLERLTAALIRDGRTLHAHWADKPEAEAQVIGGTLWMLAQATIPESVGDPRLEGSIVTYGEIGRVIRNSSTSDEPVGAKALTFFHAIAALVAFLRAEWARARHEGELAMILSEMCGFPGLLAALVVASSSAASGNTQYSEVAEMFLAEHATHGCQMGKWIEPASHLIRADAAIRGLDRERAGHHLRLHGAEGSSTHWFNVQPMHAAVVSTAAILWADPERGLAQFDSITADAGHELEHGNPWGPLMLRSRAQLLLGLGSVGRAEHLVVDLMRKADDSVSAVPEAWFLLASGNFTRAAAKADQGIYNLRISLADRAHLYAVKSAALHQAGAAEELVGSAAIAACVVCEQAETLVPFAALPSGVRSHLVTEHHRHHGETDCFISRACRRGAFDDLRDSFVGSRVQIRLTPREAVLLPLLATAATVQEIANQQFVSVNTVRKQVVSLRAKVGAVSRLDLIRRAHDLGLLRHPDRPEARS